MSLPTPEGITYGLVVARWLQIVGDTPADLDALPDTKPMSGSALFTRKQKTTIRADSTQPDGTYVGIAKQNINGYLRTVDGELARAADSEDTGLWLVTGVYTVSFSLSGTTWPSFDIEVTAAHTAEAPLDLITTTPYVPPIGATPVVIMVPASIPDGYLLAKNGASFTGVDPATLGGAAPDASETVKGIVELATSVETVTGEDGVRAVTPAGVKAALDAKSVSDMSTYATKAELAAAGGSVIMDDTPAAPAEGTSATYFVTSAVTWPAGLEWSTDPDNDVAPTITGTALVSMFTLNGTTRAVLGATFPALSVPADTTNPTWTATFTLGTPTQTAVVATASALATDNVAVTGYEVSYNNGSTYATITPSGSNFTLAGSAGVTYATTKLRARDAAGKRSTALSVPSYTMAASTDTTPPTAGTLASSNITATSATLTVSGAADETALHAQPYRFSTDNGATYSAYQTSPVYAATGLDPSTAYTCKHQTRDAAGNVSTGTEAEVTGPTSAFTDFSENALATGVPTGWTSLWADTWGAMSVKNYEGSLNGHALSVVGEAAGRKCLRFDAVPTTATTLDMVVRFRRFGAGGNSLPIGLRVGGIAAAETGYFISMDAGNIRLQRWNAGATELILPSGGAIPQVATVGWTWVRMRVEGTAIKIKQWVADGVTPEPAGWLWELTDSTLSAGGAGIGALTGDSDTLWDVVSVDWGGGIAPLVAP